LYLTDDAFADIVNSLYALGYITVANPPTPFPRVTGVPQILHGDGSPEGVVFATQGSAFMRRDNSGANNALYAKTTGPSQNTGWQAFSAAAAPTPSTTLPANPSNGQQAILVDSTSAPTYFEYSTAAAKWLFIGGSPATAKVDTSETTTSASYTDLTTVGPSITVPRAGTYEISGGCGIIGSNGQAVTYASLKVGAAATADAQMMSQIGSFGGGGSTGGTSRVFTVTANANDVLKMQYKTAAGTATFAYRTLAVRPVTVT